MMNGTEPVASSTAVIGQDGPVIQMHLAAGAINIDHRPACHQRNAVAAYQLGRMQSRYRQT
jgi:hypothetical protein